MAIGAVLEPLVIVSLLAGGTLFNRDKFYAWSSSSLNLRRPEPWQDIEYGAGGEIDSKKKRSDSVSSSSTIWHDVPDGAVMGGMDASPCQWRHRTLRVGRWEREVTVPNTEVHKDRFLSRVLRKYPFLVEVWYWALIYWVCWSTPLWISPADDNTEGLPTWARIHGRHTPSFNRRYSPRARTAGHTP